MSYTFCRVIWGWIFKDPKAKKWVGDHDDVFTYYFKILMHAFLVCIDCNKLRFSCTLGWTRSSGTSRATRTNWRTEETKWHWVSERRSGEWETTSTCSLHWFGSSVLTACLLQRFYYFFSRSTDDVRPEYFSFSRWQASHISSVTSLSRIIILKKVS